MDLSTRNSTAIVPQWQNGEKHTLSATKHALCILLIVAASSAVYLNSLNNEFVFDDIGLVRDNNVIYSLKNIPYTIKHMYRPVRVISYTIDYYFSGLNPLGYHIANIAYHAITSVIVYLVILLLVRHPRSKASDTQRYLTVPLFASILFALHPVHTDAVTYISGRRDILSTLFFLLGFYYFLRYRADSRWFYMALTMLSFFLGIFSKEMAVTLPLVFFAYDFYMHFNTRERRLNIAYFKDIGLAIKTVIFKYKYFYVPTIVTGIAFSFYAVVILNASRRVSWYGDSIVLNFLTVGRVWMHSIKLLFYPVTLITDYSFNSFPISGSILEWRSLLSLAALAVILYGVLRLLLPLRGIGSPFFKKMTAFCITWFFVSILPISHIIPHHELFAEHYLYLPSFGFCLLVALFIDKALNIFKYRNVFIALFVIAVMLYSYRTVERNRDWRDDYTLWKKTCETVPDCARAHNNLGTVYFNMGRIDEAIMEHARAAEIKPTYSNAYANLGADYVRKGRFDDAIAACKNAIELNPENASAYNTLGASLFSKGMFEEAMEACKIAIAIKPDYSRAHLNLGSIYLTTGMIDDGISACKKSISFDPDIPEAHFNLGIALMDKNQLDEAINELEMAIRLKPAYAKARKSLAIAYKKKAVEIRQRPEFSTASGTEP